MGFDPVLLNLTFPDKRRRTFGALKPLTPVVPSLSVLRPTRGGYEALAAIIALVGPLSRVPPLVVNRSHFTDQFRTANITFEVPDARVDHRMFRQSSRSVETFAAPLALVRSNVHVDPEYMILQLRSRGVCLITVIASKRGGIAYVVALRPRETMDIGLGLRLALGPVLPVATAVSELTAAGATSSHHVHLRVVIKGLFPREGSTAVGASQGAGLVMFGHVLNAVGFGCKKQGAFLAQVKGAFVDGFHVRKHGVAS